MGCIDNNKWVMLYTDYWWSFAKQTERISFNKEIYRFIHWNWLSV